MRRQFDLSETDIQFLDDYGLDWEAISDGSKWVLIYRFPTGDGYNHAEVTAAIRISAGYPIEQLDMVYFNPPLARKDGRPIARTETVQTIDGKPFQQWSRHRTAQNPWKPGFDCLETQVQLIEDWLQREFER
ncbi:MAG TPA: E2/UBC family protein [Candidatus Obscuribacterales bacterium]